MQLKDLGKGLELKNSISDILDNSKYLIGQGNLAGKKKQLIDLQNAVKGYSVEIVKTAASQVTLTEKQALAIFTAKGLEGAELDAAVASATLSTAQKTATGTTLGLSTAFKGLLVAIIKKYCINIICLV